MNNKLLLSLFISIVLLGASSAWAQNYRGQSYVTIYEDCGYRGSNRDIPAGNYADMARAGFANDRISSIKIPQGFDVTIYEDDDYRGSFAKLDRNISCFDKSWNNKVSSLKVTQQHSVHNNGAHAADHTSVNANAKNVSYVSFADQVLQQINNKQWQLSNNRHRKITELSELDRTNYAVYLQNRYTGERVRIDFFSNDVTVIDRNAYQQSYKINQTQAAYAQKNYKHSKKIIKPIKKPVIQAANHNVIRGKCFDIKAYSDGGTAGLRFSGHDGFHRYNSKPYKARICHNGEITMEVSKKNPNTSVVVELNGHRYTFAKNEKYTLLNTWYRKNLTLLVKP